VFSVARAVRSARAARLAGIEGSRRRLRLLTLSHGRVDDARRIDGIGVFSVARAARAAGIESSRRRLRLLTLSHRRVDEARRIDGIWVFSVTELCTGRGSRTGHGAQPGAYRLAGPRSTPSRPGLPRRAPASRAPVGSPRAQLCFCCESSEISESSEGGGN
jgi:hypothetical protein